MEEMRIAARDLQRQAEATLDAREKEAARAEVRLRELEARLVDEARRAETALYQERQTATCACTL